MDEEGEPVYDVEAIVTSRKASKRRGGAEYLIKWLDYGEEANTWEPLPNLASETVQSLIRDFHARNSSAFRPPNIGLMGLRL